ncbi:MAG: hypothetical protein GY835_27835 [bacterium]|nr:hypothetical protein [bacterium]
MSVLFMLCLILVPTICSSAPTEIERDQLQPDPSAMTVDISIRHRVEVLALPEDDGAVLSYFPSLELVKTGEPVLISLGDGGLALLNSLNVQLRILERIDLTSFARDARSRLLAAKTMIGDEQTEIQVKHEEGNHFSGTLTVPPGQDHGPRVIACLGDEIFANGEVVKDLAVEVSGQWGREDVLIVSNDFSTFLVAGAAGQVEVGIQRIPITFPADPIYIVIAGDATVDDVVVHLFTSDRNDDWCSDDASIWWAGNSSSSSNPYCMPFTMSVTVWETEGYGEWTHVEVYEDDPVNNDEIWDDYIQCTVAAWGGWYGQRQFSFREGIVGDHESDCVWEIVAHCWCGWICDAYSTLYLEDCRAPSRPTLTTPVSNACTSDHTPTLSCTAESDTDSDWDVDYDFEVQGEGIESSTSPSEVFSYLDDGTHYWRARSKDDCGNYSSWTSWRTLYIDSTDPNISDLYWGDSYNCSASEESYYYNCETAYLVVRGSNFADCPSTITATVTESLFREGSERYSVPMQRQGSTCYLGTWNPIWEDDWFGNPEFKFSVTITDNCGNDDSDTSPTVELVDNQAPSGPNLNSPGNGADVCTGNVTFSWSSGSDNCSGLHENPYKLKISRNSNLSNSTTVCGWTDDRNCSRNFDEDDSGRWYWGVEIRDAAGNSTINGTRYFDVITPASVNDARWSLANDCNGSEAASASDCQTLYLIVRGAGFAECPSQISAHIWEDDLPGARYGAVLTRQNDTCYLGSWEPVWEDDEVFDPEYQFSVEFQDDCDNDLSERSEPIGMEDGEIPSEAAELVGPAAGTTVCIGDVDFSWMGGADACSGLHDQPYKLVRSRFSNLANPQTLCGWTGSTSCQEDFGDDDTGSWYWSVIVRDREGNERTAVPRQLIVGEGTSIESAYWTLTSDCDASQVTDLDDCTPVYLVVKGTGFLNAPDQISADINEVDPIGARSTTVLQRIDDGCYIGQWATEWIEDWWFDPEYKFTVEFSDNCGESHEKESELLRLEDHYGPSPVSLIQPSHGEDVESGHIYFSWGDSEDGCAGMGERPYRLVASRHSNFQNIVLDSGWLTQAHYSTFISPLDFGNWYWRVYSRDTKGNTTLSDSSMFSIDAAQSVAGRIPYPILFVHGIAGSYLDWYMGRDDHYHDSVLSILEDDLELDYGQILHITCDYNPNHSQLYDPKGTDVRLFGGGTLTTGDYYLVNFDVDRDGPGGGRSGTPNDSKCYLMESILFSENNLFVSSAQIFKVDDVVHIGSEYMIVEEVNLFTIDVSRGQFGSTHEVYHGLGSQIYIVSNQSNQAGIVKQAYGLSQAIDAVTTANGVEKVVLVGHSMGGIVSRYCAEREAVGKVAKVLTVDSPNLGSVKGEFPDGIDEVLEYGLEIDVRSEAARDLAYHYSIEYCTSPPSPGYPNSSDDGVFLWSGSENHPDLMDNLFHNRDVDANGSIGDQINGLNVLPMQAGADYEFAQIVGQAGMPWGLGPCGSMDGMIQTDRQWIHIPAEYRVRNVQDVLHHWVLIDMLPTSDNAILGVQDALMWGLDEPENSLFAYELYEDREYIALVTPDAGEATDTDWFLATHSWPITVFLDDLPQNEGVFHWVNSAGEHQTTPIVSTRNDPNRNEWSLTIGEEGEPGDEIRFAIELPEYQDSWKTPYRIWWSADDVPVMLSDFDLTYLSGVVKLDWLYRDSDAPALQRLIGRMNDHEWEVPISSLGNGHFESIDRSAVIRDGGEIAYNLYGRIDAADTDWIHFRYSTVIIPAVPQVTRLSGVYPNPFNPQTRIEFSLAEPCEVQLFVRDVAGRLVRVLLREPRDSGVHSVVWDGKTDDGARSASGVYFVELRVPSSTDAIKVILLQ